MTRGEFIQAISSGAPADPELDAPLCFDWLAFVIFSLLVVTTASTAVLLAVLWTL